MLLFWERGYETVGTRELCAAMGISAPSLYNAFTSKQVLFEEVIRCYAERYTGFVEAAFVDEPDARGATERLLTGAAHQYTRPGCPAGCLIMNNSANFAGSSEEVAATLRTIRGTIGERVQAKLQEDVDSGRLPASLDLRGLAMHILAIWNGMAMQARDGAGREDLESAIATFMATWPAGADESAPA